MRLRRYFITNLIGVGRCPIRGVNRRTENGTVEPLSSESGVDAVKSPVRVLILETLREGEVPFDEIVRRTGRAKSTVSVHLRDMVDEGIVGWRLDPADARKKLFFTNAERIGAVSSSERISAELVEVRRRLPRERKRPVRLVA